MDRQRGEQLFNRLVRYGSTVPASVFPESSTWSWLKDPVKLARAAGPSRAGLGMLGVDPISLGLDKLAASGGRLAFASSLAGGLLAGAGAFMGIWGGLADVGRAKIEGQQIAQARLAIGTYVKKYAETLAGHAQALDESSAYQPQMTAGLSAWLKPWEQRAIADAHAVLKTLGEQDGRAVLQYLQDSYGGATAVTRALRQEVMTQSLQNLSPQLRRLLNPGGELGGGAQVNRIDTPFVVETKIPRQQPFTRIDTPFVIETKLPHQRPFTRINTPFVIETKKPHQPFGGSSGPTLFQQLNQQLQNLDAGPSSSFKPIRLFDADSRRQLGLSNLTFGGSGGSFSIVPSLSRSGGGGLRDLWDSGSGFGSLASRPPGSNSSFQPVRLFDADSRERLGLSNLKFGGFGDSFSILPSLSRPSGGLRDLWDAGSSYRPPTSSLLDNSLSLRDIGSRLSLGSLRQDAWHSPWRGPSLGLSLGGSSGGPLSSLWNTGSGFSSGSVSLPSVRLGTSPSLTPWGSPFSQGFNTPAWQGVGGLSSGPNLSSFARGL